MTNLNGSTLIKPPNQLNKDILTKTCSLKRILKSKNFLMTKNGMDYLNTYKNNLKKKKL
jgi:hypothetical protein